jgi:transposase
VARAAWRQEAQAIAAERWVFVDECGSHLALTPLYARAPKGERASGSVPRNRGHNTTILGALSWQGLQAAMTLEGAADGLAFEAFVAQVLVPTLEPGQMVVMENLSIHKRDTVRALIEEAACQVLFLPAYSPDFSPIEQAWSKLKAHLRQVQARTQETLEVAIAEAIKLITAHDAQAWFSHCGYA